MNVYESRWDGNVPDELTNRFKAFCPKLRAQLFKASKPNKLVMKPICSVFFLWLNDQIHWYFLLKNVRNFCSAKALKFFKKKKKKKKKKTLENCVCKTLMMPPCSACHMTCISIKHLQRINWKHTLPCKKLPKMTKLKRLWFCEN